MLKFRSYAQAAWAITNPWNACRAKAFDPVSGTDNLMPIWQDLVYTRYVHMQLLGDKESKPPGGYEGMQHRFMGI